MSSIPLDSPAACAAMLRQLYADTLLTLDPGPLVAEELRRNPMAEGEISLLALGKAAVSMARAAEEVLGSRIQESVVVAPVIPSGMPKSWLASSHPDISERSQFAAKALLDASARARGEVLVLLSGGGSALAAEPLPGLSLAAKSQLIAQLAASGVAIDELNIVRKHLSAFKGGRLAAAAKVPLTTLLVSDVVGDALSTIASGPTLPDESTYAEALAIVETRLGQVEGAAADCLRRGALGQLEETPAIARPGDRHCLLAGISTLAETAADWARPHGLTAHLLAEPVAGSIESVCTSLLAWANGPGLWIAGGEATLSLPAEPGSGGRAQHLALRLACEIRGEEVVHALVAGSDGVDGNSQAAGAVVDNQSYQRLRAMGISPEESLERCDSGTALAALDAQIFAGPTGVNYADLIVLFRPG